MFVYLAIKDQYSEEACFWGICNSKTEIYGSYSSYDDCVKRLKDEIEKEIVNLEFEPDGYTRFVVEEPDDVRVVYEEVLDSLEYDMVYTEFKALKLVVR